MEFRPDQLRVLEDSAKAYDVWIQARRQLDALGPPLHWRKLSGSEYLYERLGSAWGQSQGVRAADTEALHERDVRRRQELQTTLDATGARLEELGAMYRALRLRRIHPTAGAILREADRRGLLGTTLIVVGTNAMPAYEIEAQVQFDEGLTATTDCDLAWIPKVELALTGRAAGPRPVYSLLKAVDELFTVNQERPFQARDRAGYEVELLLSAAAAATYPKSEELRPVPLPEQDWLLNGRFVEHVVFDQKNQPARLVVPDPRWMALHKLWIADKPGRNPLKVAKDRQQGEHLARETVLRMRGFPVDAGFRAQVPLELQAYLARFPQIIVPSGFS